MTKNPKIESVGDDKSPALKPDSVALRDAVDQAMMMIAEPAPKLDVLSQAGSMALAMRGNVTTSSTDCQQRIWLSFFFDGTGNNLDADVGTGKHSNVAKLYRCHLENEIVSGIYRIYVPGVGTYFKEVGDDGGSALGLGTGYMGDARLGWALKQFDELLGPHIARAKSPGNTILEINVALFGFSRGAALARAFSNQLLEKRCTVNAQQVWRLKDSGHHLRIRFMGIFDTVASVGLPMSANNINVFATVFGVRQIIRTRVTAEGYASCRPQVLAYAQEAQPGADPSPGIFDGHSDWGGLMAIPHMVEEVRHFVAAHELRNSFPVDSVSVLDGGLVIKPAHFYESVYPGVHSDVGGSYRTGEGARSQGSNAKLGLVPLHDMYQFALSAGVPLFPKTAWDSDQLRDFDVDPGMVDLYNYYQEKVRGISNLGPLMNSHMALYYAWRFRAIRLKEAGDTTEVQAISTNSQQFTIERAALDKEIGDLETNCGAAERALSRASAARTRYLRQNYGSPELLELESFDRKIAEAQIRQSNTQDALLRARAKRDALPDMTHFASLVEMYDQQLLADVRAIRGIYAPGNTLGGNPSEGKRQDLRPHYKVLMDAYENEYIHNTGLKDEKIISFFDSLVHDSLAGFAKDATLPSDPRVVYLGGDEKYRYAVIERLRGQRASKYAGTHHGTPEEIEV